MKTFWLAGGLWLAVAGIAQGQLTFVTNGAVITLTSYAGPQGPVAIPDFVTGIANEAFVNSQATVVSIPASVTSVGSVAFSGSGYLAEINVAADNPDFSSSGGVLFDRSQTALICVPSSSGVGLYAVPSGVVTIESDAFEGCYSRRSSSRRVLLLLR